jgi:hypothetical protein
MLRQLLVPIPQAAEIDNASHVGRGGGLREVGRRLAIIFLEIPLISHRMHEIVCRIDPLQSGVETLAIEQVAAHDFRRCGHAARHVLGSPRKAADTDWKLLQQRQKTATDISGRASQKNQALAIVHRAPVKSIDDRGELSPELRRTRDAGHRAAEVSDGKHDNIVVVPFSNPSTTTPAARVCIRRTVFSVAKHESKGRISRRKSPARRRASGRLSTLAKLRQLADIARKSTGRPNSF